MSEKFCADQTPQGKNIFSGCRTVYISSFVLLSEVRCTFRHMTPMTRKKPSQQPEVVFHRLTGWSMWTAHYLYRAPTNSLLITVKASKSVGTACSSHQPPPVCHSQHDLCVSEHPQSRHQPERFAVNEVKHSGNSPHSPEVYPYRWKQPICRRGSVIIQFLEINWKWKMLLT